MTAEEDELTLYNQHINYVICSKDTNEYKNNVLNTMTDIIKNSLSVFFTNTKQLDLIHKNISIANNTIDIQNKDKIKLEKKLDEMHNQRYKYVLDFQNKERINKELKSVQYMFLITIFNMCLFFLLHSINHKISNILKYIIIVLWIIYLILYIRTNMNRQTHNWDKFNFESPR